MFMSSTRMGEFTRKNIKGALFTIGAASFIGMIAAFDTAKQVISVPSVEDQFLNKPATAIYANPNQGFLNGLGVGLMSLASASTLAGCHLSYQDSKKKLSAPMATATRSQQTRQQQPISSGQPRSMAQQQPLQPQLFPQEPDIEFSDFSDPWETDNDSQVQPEFNPDFLPIDESSEGQEWIFDGEQELEHPALDYRNWQDQLALLIYGEQGGGKTSKLLYLAEQHIKAGNIVLIVSDFAYSGWIKGIEVAGVNGDFNAIAQALNAFCNEGEARRKTAGVYQDKGYFAHDLPTVVLIADEVTSWSEQPELEMVIFRLARLVLQDLRQTNMRVYLGGHGNTLATLFGKALAGKKQTFDNQFTQIQCKAKHDKQIENGKRCAGEVVVSYFQGKDPVARTIKIPSLLPSKDCTKTISYTTSKGDKSQKVVYDFGKYNSIPFSQYHAEENDRRKQLKNQKA